jgi:hypothetical protein
MINPDLVLNPLSIYEVLQPDKQDTVPLQITNNTTAGFNYLVKKHPEVDWFSLGGMLNGFLNAGQTTTVDVYFDTEGMPADTLYSYIIIEYGEGEQFLEPVHLVVDPFVAIENDGRTAGLYDAKNVTMHVWPNPAREGLRFKVLGLSAGVNYKIGIYNSAGMMVFSRELKEGRDELKMDVSSLPKGIYLVTLLAEEKPVTAKKIIIN